MTLGDVSPKGPGKECIMATMIQKRTTAARQLPVAEYVQTYRKHPEIQSWCIAYVPGRGWSPLYASESQLFRELGDKYQLVRNGDLKPPRFDSRQHERFNPQDEVL
jgi:hypothetical protein